MLQNVMYKREAINNFETARYWATGRWFWSKLTGRNRDLISFNDLRPYLSTNRVYRGIQDIPLAQIIGSVNRTHSFDREFLPQSNDLYERWIQVRVLASTQGWEPIDVYKVGNIYFVEDGHHRVSVAHRLGNQVIEAAVWEYPLEAEFDLGSSLEQIVACLEQTQIGTCVATPAFC